MLDYTKTAVEKVVNDFKQLNYLRDIATQILYIFYLLYALIAGAGIMLVNGILLFLSSAYFLFFLLVTTGKTDKAKIKTRKIVRNVFTRCKQAIKLFSLGVMIYGIYATTTHVTALSVILSAFLIVGWILQVVFEVILRFFINRANLLLEGLKADAETITKPAKTVGNFFKKITGQEVEPEKERSKTRIWLDNKVAESRAERKEEKARTKQEKREAKLEAKRLAKQKRIDAKFTVFFPTTEDTIDEPQPEEVFEQPPQIDK